MVDRARGLRPEWLATSVAGITAGSAQYRRRYAEPEAVLASACPGSFDHVAVVPVCAERATFVEGYRAAAKRAGRVLLVVVLNGRDGASASVHEANGACFRVLRERLVLREVHPGGWLGRDGPLEVLLVDRFAEGRRLPTRQGVGLARKIGADVALELIATGRVRHPLIAMIDADATLPADYFTRVAELETDCAAAVFPFWHEPGGDAVVDRATALYELRLRYLQRGLQCAGSPYAFHSLGSTMVIHALCYAQVRGVPSRQAAEDFYLLVKLSKLRPVVRLIGNPVRLRSRRSGRVPFGTGAATEKLARGAQLDLDHPECFAAVRDVVCGLSRVAERPPVDRAVETCLSRLSPVVREWLHQQGALRAWFKVCQQAPSPVARLHRLHEWFDGFRTLKLMHYVRDRGASSLPWREAVGRAPFMDDVEDDGACLADARVELLSAEQALPRLVGPCVAPLMAR